MSKQIQLPESLPRLPKSTREKITTWTVIAVVIITVGSLLIQYILPIFFSNKLRQEVTYKVWCEKCTTAEISYHSNPGQFNEVQVVKTTVPWEKSIGIVSGGKYVGVDALVVGGGKVYCSVWLDGKEAWTDSASPYVNCYIPLAEK